MVWRQMDSEFGKCLEDAVGPAAASVVTEALEGPASVSVRLNPFKWNADAEAAGRHFSCGASSVQWSGHGFLLDTRPSFTLDPYLHAGAYYVQDSSAMFVGELFRHCMAEMEPVGRPFRVLDLCAAPGGKTTDLAASLRERFGNGFILVANEVIRGRAGVLSDNAALWGDPNVVVTSADPAAFSWLGGFFDMVLADVPCSGEGMFRKDPEAVSQWSMENVALCRTRQRRIVADVWPALSPDGILVYSTCTFNRYENDDNVRWICDTLGAENAVPGSMQTLADSGGAMRTGSGFLLLPGFVPGEGQYCAAVRKTAAQDDGKPAAVKIRRGPGIDGRKGNDGPAAWFREEVRFRTAGDMLVAVPESIDDDVRLVSAAVRTLRSGCTVGRMKGKILVPDADLALDIMLADGAFPSAELDRGQALSFLHGDAMVIRDRPEGYLSVCYDGLPVGFVKNLGTRCNNLHPQTRRIRMDIDKDKML